MLDAQTQAIFRRLSSSDSLLLGAFTGLSYFVAYCYERAYAQTFGFPPELIELRWPTVLGGAGTVVIVGLATVAFAFAADRLSRLARGKFSTWTASVVDTLLAGFVAMVLPLIFGLNLRVAAAVAAFVVLLSIIATALGLRRYDSRIRSATSISNLRLVAAAAILSIAFVVIHTRYSLAREKNFYVLAGTQPEVVARIYGDKLITVRLDARNRVLLPVYRVWPLAQTPRLTKMTLGRITPVCFSGHRNPLSRSELFMHSWLDDTPNEYADLYDRCRVANLNR